jgi:hypothetical protein
MHHLCFALWKRNAKSQDACVDMISIVSIKLCTRMKLFSHPHVDHHLVLYPFAHYAYVWAAKRPEVITIFHLHLKKNACETPAREETRPDRCADSERPELFCRRNQGAGVFGRCQTRSRDTCHSRSAGHHTLLHMTDVLRQFPLRGGGGGGTSRTRQMHTCRWILSRIWEAAGREYWNINRISMRRKGAARARARASAKARPPKSLAIEPRLNSVMAIRRGPANARTRKISTIAPDRFA